MRIGMAQMDISWENIEDNKKKVEQFFKKAEENQVDCLVFPEMTLTGFSMWKRQEKNLKIRNIFLRK